MTISDICIKRPVFATVLSLIVVLVGLVSYDRLSVRQYPNIDPPIVNVSTTYRGASAEIVESQITDVIEDTLAGIEGIETITSSSRQGRSQVSLRFDLSRDPSDAAADVRDRVSRVRGRLPDEIDEPVIQKVEADARPIMYLAFSSDRHSTLELTDFAERNVKDQLSTVPGVAEVRIFGGKPYAMRIWLDPLRMAAFDMTPQDVENALRRQNVEIPSGTIESLAREFSVVSETDLSTEQQFNDLILRNTGDYLIRLSDVGFAEIGAQRENSAVRFNGDTAVALGVVKQATANPLEVSAGVRDRLPELVDTLPEGMSIDIGYDQAVFIDASLDSVYQTLIEAVILVTVIIFLFLGSLRASLIPLVTIPVSLIGAFALMFFFGFSINTLTLLAMVLAIGLVVDDAIVMLENIHRHVEAGLTPREAAFKGSREIIFAIIGMTITLAAVFAPIAFMTGTTGRLFTEFALALAGAVLVSGFVALTLSPMMCATLLKEPGKEGWFARIVNWVLGGLTRGYRAVLSGGMRVRPLVLLIGMGVASGSYFIYQELPQELTPTEDQGTLIGFFRGPEGATLEFTDKYARQIEDIYASIPEAERYFVITGFSLQSSGISFVGLKHWDERERSASDIANSIRGRMFGVPGVMAFAISPRAIGGRGSKPVQFVVQSTGTYEDLGATVDQIMTEIRDYPGLTNVEIDLKLNKPQLVVEVDRDRIADLGIDVDTVGRTLETLVGGRQVTRFDWAGEQYDVLVQLQEVNRNAPEDLSTIYVRSGNGEMVQLSNLVQITETVAPQELKHFDKFRSVTIEANVAPGYSLGQVLAYLDEVAEEILPPTDKTDLAGESRELSDASATIALTFGLAIAFIFLVLAAQFESFRDPFTILITVPLSVTGGLLALHLTGGSSNIYSQVGVVALIGIISKHGILLVEFANQLREQGRDLKDAAVEAATMRLRPILMTTAATVLGAIPLAIATGAGAQARQDIGWVIVGGLLVGTLFTLFVIPVVYTYLARRDRRSLAEPMPTRDNAVPVPGTGD